MDRRGFLKLLSLLPAAHFLPATRWTPTGNTQSDLPNILIVVFDAWSARNVSLYGYPRQTTPNIDRLAEKAIVYHNHYAGGHYTFPGTAALLTGALNWTHQGFNLHQPMDDFFRANNIFSLFDDYHRTAYTHNTIANEILKFMRDQVSEYLPSHELYLRSDKWLSKVFDRDQDIATVSWVRVAKKFDDGYANSLFLSRLYDLFVRTPEDIAARFPLGIPQTASDNYYLLEDGFDWIYEHCRSLESPYLGYYHLLPPHSPYLTRQDFYDRFAEDDLNPIKKAEHPFSLGQSHKELLAERKAYDEYMLYADAEFARFYEQMQDAGALDNTWLILTSDHGEMFERGIAGHGQPIFYQPVANIPLLIFPPGAQKREDIHASTSAVDLLPTLLHLTGKPRASWLEGHILPPFNPSLPKDRSIFAMDTKMSKQYKPFKNASMMVRKENYKFHYVFGRRGRYELLESSPLVELFDVEADPEELTNLAEKKTKLTASLKDELFAKMVEKGAR